MFTKGTFSRYQRNSQKYKNTRYSLANRAFLKATMSIVCTEFPGFEISFFTIKN